MRIGTRSRGLATANAGSRGRTVACVMMGATAIVAVGLGVSARGASVVGSKHDLSDGSVDPYSNQVCVFCHTPHSANVTNNYPLWNRFIDTTKVFTLYSSSTMNTVPGNPQATNSILCLGCHDGTLGTGIVNGITGSDKHVLVNAPGPGGIPDTTSWPNCQRCHPDIYGGQRVRWLGTNLGDDHPIAMTYPTQAQDSKFNLPPDLGHGWPDVPLYNGKVECATCHNVHDSGITPFLRISNVRSALCVKCHIK